MNRGTLLRYRDVGSCRVLGCRFHRWVPVGFGLASRGHGRTIGKSTRAT